MIPSTWIVNPTGLVATATLEARSDIGTHIDYNRATKVNRQIVLRSLPKFNDCSAGSNDNSNVLPLLSNVGELYQMTLQLNSKGKLIQAGDQRFVERYSRSHLSLSTLAETPARQISRPVRSTRTTVGIRSADGLNVPTMLSLSSTRTKLRALTSFCVCA